MIRGGGPFHLPKLGSDCPLNREIDKIGRNLHADGPQRKLAAQQGGQIDRREENQSQTGREE